MHVSAGWMDAIVAPGLFKLPCNLLTFCETTQRSSLLRCSTAGKDVPLKPIKTLGHSNTFYFTRIQGSILQQYILEANAILVFLPSVLLTVCL